MLILLWIETKDLKSSLTLLVATKIEKLALLNDEFHCSSKFSNAFLKNLPFWQKSIPLIKTFSDLKKFMHSMDIIGICTKKTNSINYLKTKIVPTERHTVSGWSCHYLILDTLSWIVLCHNLYAMKIESKE